MFVDLPLEAGQIDGPHVPPLNDDLDGLPGQGVTEGLDPLLRMGKGATEIVSLLDHGVELVLVLKLELVAVLTRLRELARELGDLGIELTPDQPTALALAARGRDLGAELLHAALLAHPLRDCGITLPDRLAELLAQPLGLGPQRRDPVGDRTKPLDLAPLRVELAPQAIALRYGGVTLALDRVQLPTSGHQRLALGVRLAPRCDRALRGGGRHGPLELASTTLERVEL